MSAVIEDLRPDPPGWLVRFVGPLNGWEAVARDFERPDSLAGEAPAKASGPVWFTGHSRSDVLDLIYEYELQLLEKKRAEWCEEALEVLEYIQCQMELGATDSGDLHWGESAVEFVRRMVRRQISTMPPREKKL